MGEEKKATTALPTPIDTSFPRFKQFGVALVVFLSGLVFVSVQVWYLYQFTKWPNQFNLQQAVYKYHDDTVQSVVIAEWIVDYGNDYAVDAKTNTETANSKSTTNSTAVT